MIAEAIEKILSLGGSKTEKINGRTYSNSPKGIVPLVPPRAETLRLNTLTGVVDYCGGKAIQGTMIHIAGPGDVKLIDEYFDSENWLTRSTYLHASHESPTFSFGRRMDPETFIITLQAMFVPDENTAAILKVVGNITEEAVKTFSDDGVTQSVTAKVGISRVEQVSVPNPVTLRPYRTFREVEQPASTFVFRMRGEKGETPSCALFEADGKMWELEAIQAIKFWLADKLKGAKVIA